MPLASPRQRGSPQQRLLALGRANEVRRQRAQIKRALAAGSTAFAQVLADPPACVRTAKVCDLLLSVPGVGPAKSNRALVRCRIADSKTIGGLSDRQRAALIEELASTNRVPRCRAGSL